MIVLAVLTVSVTAFLPPQPFAINPTRTISLRPINMGFGLGDEPPKKLTRDSEPEDYFKTNM